MKKINKSTLLFIFILVFVTMCFSIFYKPFNNYKRKTYKEMDLLLSQNETPENIDRSEEQLNNNKEAQNNNKEQQNKEDISNENEIKEEVSSNSANTTQTPEVAPQPPSNNTPQPNNNPKDNYIGKIEIPKINVKANFYDFSSKYNNVDYTVAVIKGSTFPDRERNNLILAAHSGDCSFCHFRYLYKLKLGDVAYIYYKNIKYEYKIVDIYKADKDGNLAIYYDDTKNTLTLITCTKNDNTLQTIYILELYKKG